MRLLILTQKVNKKDPILGFFHRWIEEFAKNCEKVVIICLEKGEYNLPKNVRVLSLGKEDNLRNTSRGISKIVFKIKYLFRFYKYIWQERKNYNAVFVHMNPIYVVLAGIFWRLLNKKIALWYTHKQVDLKLKIAEKFVDVILTATKTSFRLNSRKIKIMGHGIDLKRFRDLKSDEKNKILKIITVGRISPVKDYETLISAIELLIKRNILLHVYIVGNAGTIKQKEYVENIKESIKEKKLGNYFSFVGGVPNEQLPKYLRFSDIFVNMSHTGSLDKAILEAMASGVLVVTCNESFLDIIKSRRDELFFYKKDYEELAEKIYSLRIKSTESKKFITTELKNIVKSGHGLEKLIKKILKEYGK